MSERTIQDRLREEYFDLLPEISLVADELEARIQFYTLDIAQNLAGHEHRIVKARVKECESAIKALEKRSGATNVQEPSGGSGQGQRDRLGGTFNPDTPERDSLTELHDLAGVRVLAFPPRRLREIDQELQKHFHDWEADPFKDVGDQLAFKYYGRCPKASTRVCRRIPNRVYAYRTLLGRRTRGHL